MRGSDQPDDPPQPVGRNVANATASSTTFIDADKMPHGTLDEDGCESRHDQRDRANNFIGVRCNYIACHVAQDDCKQTDCCPMRDLGIVSEHQKNCDEDAESQDAVDRAAVDNQPAHSGTNDSQNDSVKDDENEHVAKPTFQKSILLLYHKLT